MEADNELATELGDLEDFDHYDSTHLFWEQLKQLGFAFREIRREDVSDEEVEELLKASEPILAILSRIQAAQRADESDQSEALNDASSVKYVKKT